MKKITIIILVILIGIPFAHVTHFFHPNTAEAQANIPEPANGCAQTINNGLNIECSYNGNTAVFSFEGYYRTFGYVENYLYQMWSLRDSSNSALAPVRIITYSDPPESKSNLKIYFVSIPIQNTSSLPSSWQSKVINKPIESIEIYSYLRLKEYNISTERMEGLESVMKVINDEEGWSTIKPNVANNVSLLAIDKLVNRLPVVTAEALRNSIEDDKRTSCSAGSDGKSLLVQPVSSISNGTQNGLEKYYSEMKAGWLAELEKLTESEERARAIALVNDTFSQPDKLYTASEDVKIFKQFYDDNYSPGKEYPPNYPTVIVDQSKYNEYTAYASALSTYSASSDFNGLDYWSVFGDVLQKGGVTMHDLDSALPWWADNAVGTVNPVAGLANFTIKYVTSSADADLKTMIKEQTKVYFAHMYIKNNLLFNKCVGEPWAYASPEEIDKMIANVDAILSSTYDSANPYATENGEPSVCDALKGTAILVLIKQAFCGMAIVMNDWANDVFLKAIQLLQSSLGVNSPTTSSTTSSTSSGLTPEQETELKNQAKEICQTQKSAIGESTEEWTNGPCLADKAGDYQIDITNTEGQPVDANPDNMCSGNKIIKYNHDCSFISISSQTSENP